MTDNFALIRPLLKFEEDGDFYFLEILKRKKDGCDIQNGHHNSARCVKDYYIDSFEKFDAIRDDVVRLCNENNARAYIRLNRRNFKMVSLKFAEEVLERIRTNIKFNDPQVASVDIDNHNVFKSVSLKFAEEILEGVRTNIKFNDPGVSITSVIGRTAKEKTWLVDIDNHSVFSDRVKDVKNIISRCRPLDVDKIIATLPTKSGTHLIVRKFDLNTFNSIVKEEIDLDNGEVSVHKDNPTILYCP